MLYLPLYLQLGRGFGIGASGLLLLPITLSLAASSALTGRSIARTGHLTAYPKRGLAISTAAFVALAATITFAPTAVVLALTLLAGAGLGTTMPPTQIIVQSAGGNERLASAVASVSVSRSLGGALGVAIVGAVLYLLIGREDALLATPVEAVAMTMQKRAERHIERMAGVSERGVDYVETMDGPEILNSVDEIEKLDKGCAPYLRPKRCSTKRLLAKRVEPRRISADWWQQSR